MSQWSSEGGGPSDPPPGWDDWPGWAEAGVGPPPGDPRVPDLSALIALVDGLRGQLPPELARQLADALRELLIAIRAVLDYTIEKLEQPPPSEREVEDIPIS